MRTSLRTMVSAAVAVVATVALSAAEDGVDTRGSIADRLNGGGGTVEILQPQELNQRITPTTTPTTVAAQSESQEQSADTPKKQTGATVKTVGYRVQVYSDNNARTAKAEAQARGNAIARRFPQYRTYVVYNSPYWRLRVGDFKTMEDAKRAMSEMKSAFPTYGKEMRIVKDKVTLPAD